MCQCLYIPDPLNIKSVLFPYYAPKFRFSLELTGKLSAKNVEMAVFKASSRPEESLPGSAKNRHSAQKDAIKGFKEEKTNG